MGNEEKKNITIADVAEALGDNFVQEGLVNRSESYFNSIKVQLERRLQKNVLCAVGISIP